MKQLHKDNKSTVNSHLSIPWPRNGPLVRYVALRITDALGMPGTFSPPPRVNDPDMRDARAVMHAGMAN